MRTCLVRVTLLLACLGAAPAAASAAELVTYPLPPSVSISGGLAVDGSGIVWTSATDPAGKQPRLVRADPAQLSPGGEATVTQYPTPTFDGASCCATQIRTLDIDTDLGRVLFARSDGMFGYAAPGELIPGGPDGMQYALTPGNPRAGLWGLAYDKFSKDTWLTEYTASNVAQPAVAANYFAGNRVARATPTLGLTELPNIAQQGGEASLVSLRYDAKPKAIAADGSGGAWFVQSDPGNPGYRVAHTQGAGAGYTEYLITPCLGISPCSGSFTGTGPSDVTVGADGSVWFTNEINRTIGRLDPSTGTFSNYSTASFDGALAAGVPRSIRVASDGTIWVAVRTSSLLNSAANALLRIVPGALVTDPVTADVFATGTAAPLTISPASTGDVWATLTAPSGSGGLLGRVVQAIAGGGVGGGGGGGGGGTPAPTPPPGETKVAATTVGQAQVGKTTTSGDTASVRQICVGPPQDKCSLVYLLDSREFVKGFPNTKPPTANAGRLAATQTKPKSKPKKKGTVQLGRTAEITLSGGETKTIQVRLSKKARALLSKRRTLKATLTTYQRQPDGTMKAISKKPLTFKAKRPKSKAK